MTYVDGFVIAVPKANKDRFIAHARLNDEIFMEHGATRVVECWQDDVPAGKQTDFFRAVACKEDEAVAFAWIEWPDKETREKGMATVTQLMQTDPRLTSEDNAMPFDGMRMIYGGFTPVVTLGE
ncbi:MULTISPECIES: DUF1428 domain-containing protein [unclassified Novosphingobium]|uniref:DUF1428 domain-containing protein n=1 Tax=unclassified Novosphingobium TaxID=2644732 RepID=UPI00135BC656|nr:MULTISPECIES: DUF1428 domain-containing protein [unclassified Novosphingobium]